MKKIGLFAFGVTTCVLVPTTLRLLQAGPNQVAKLFAADEKSIQIGDARVDISLDRALVDAGSKVHVTLTATADKHIKVPLAVLVYEQAGMSEGRTESPPRQVGRDEVTLDVVNGKVSKTFAFTLPGSQYNTMEGMARFGHYTMLVMSPKAADELEAKRRHVTTAFDPKGFFAAYGSLDTRDQGSDSDGQAVDAVARLDVRTRTISDHLSIVAGDTARAGDVAIKVRVHNPTAHAFGEVQLALATQTEELAGEWLGIAGEQVTIDDDTQKFALAAHETKDIVFHVHTTATGTLGLFASLQCSGDDCYDDAGRGRDASRLNDSVLDAIDILPATQDSPNPIPAVAANTAPMPVAVAPIVAQAPQPQPAKPAQTAQTAQTAQVSAVDPWK